MCSKEEGKVFAKNQEIGVGWFWSSDGIVLRGIGPFSTKEEARRDAIAHGMPSWHDKR